MKSTFTNPDWNRRSPKIIEWAVFLGFCAAAAWCFWFYYDTTQKLEKTETSNITAEVAVKEATWKKVMAAETQRAKTFLIPPSVARDPFK